MGGNPDEGRAFAGVLTTPNVYAMHSYVTTARMRVKIFPFSRKDISCARYPPARLRATHFLEFHPASGKMPRSFAKFSALEE